MQKPTVKPNNPNFGSGPCSKRPNWSCDIYKDALLGRSHRSAEARQIIENIINLQRELLGVPNNYKMAIVPASDTGAMESALWNLAGAKPMTVVHCGEFSNTWAKDLEQQLKLKDVEHFSADFGEFPDLSSLSKITNRDIVITYNETTSGVSFPNLEILPKNNSGLVICDATSAAFGVDIDFSKIDVLVYSWQKVLGGEAGFGMMILSPKAVERINSYSPSWPMPKIFNLRKNGSFNEDIFNGATINTVSMLILRDIEDALEWAKSIGGAEALQARTKANSEYLYNFIDSNEYLEGLCRDKNYRSKTSVCFKIKDNFMPADRDESWKIVKDMVKELAKENVALDVAGYKTAPPSFRVWCGPTIELEDIKILCEWLEWLLEEELSK